MAKVLLHRVRLGRTPGPVECAMFAGALAATFIFASRWIGGDLAPVLMQISAGF